MPIHASPTAKDGRQFPTWVGFPLLVGATLLAYWPAIGAGLIWDDNAHVTRPDLQSLGGLWRIWFHLGATQQYYPVLHSAFWLEHRLWGESPMGYHLANILLHAAAAGMLAVVLRRLVAPALSRLVPWLAALIFALHPMCAESVAWVSEEKNTLSTLFYLLAAWMYLRWREKGEPSKDGGAAGGGATGGLMLYFAATGFFVLSLLSKSVTASLPAAILVVLWWKNGRITWKRDIAPMIPWFVIGASAGLFTAWVERQFVGASGSDFSLGAAQRCLLACRIVWFYLGKLLWPANLIFIYPRWKVGFGPVWIAGAAALVALFWALWLLRRRARGPLAAMLFFVGSLFPALGFVNVYPFIFSYVADHFQYLASLGVVTAAALSWGYWYASAKAAARIAPVACACAAVCVLGVLTRMECPGYHDVETFYRRILSRNPDCWMAHNNLGFVLQGAGKTAEAMSHYEAALRLRYDYAEAHNNLGAALYTLGRFQEAIGHYHEAIRLFGNYIEAHNNLGAALNAIGRRSEAITEFEKVIRLRPNYPNAHGNLGIALVDAKRIPEAVEQFKACLALGPQNPDIEFNLAAAYALEGETADAMTTYEKVIKMTPTRAPPHNNLGNIYFQLGKYPEASAEYRSAIQLDASYADPHNNLGQILIRSGKAAEAEKEYQLAVDKSPKDPSFRFNLGTALASEGKRSEAMAEFQQSVLLKPDYAEGYNNLAAMYILDGRFPEAIKDLKEAIRLNPDYVDAHKNMAVVLRKLNRESEADAESKIVSRLGAASAKPK